MEVDRRTTRISFFDIILKFETKADWILTQIFLAITNLCIERKKKRIKFFSFAIREIFQPHRFLSICPSSTTSLLSRCQLETPFLFHRHLADGRSFRPTTWHRLPSSKFEDGNVAEDGKKELTKRYSLSLSHTHIYRRWKFSYYGRSRDADKRPSSALPVVSHFRVDDDVQNSEI